jgi:hypothetical protein
MSDDNHEPPGVLNSKQQDVYRICSEYFSYESRQRQNCLRAVEHSVAVSLLLIHGAPGTGKYFLVSHVVQRALSLAIRTNACAYTGSASVNFEGGQTLFTLLGIPMTAPSSNISLSNLSQNSITSLRVAFRYGRTDQSAILFIYEVSLLTSIMISMIDKSLKEIFDSLEIFGGIAVIMLGDFQQLDPVKGKSLPSSIVEHLVNRAHADR